MERKERLRVIVKSKQVTKEDREFLLALCEELGVKVARTRCNACWLDVAVQCYGKLTQPTRRKYILKEGRECLWMGLHINNATITDELAERIIKAGYPASDFEICE